MKLSTKISTILIAMIAFVAWADAAAAADCALRDGIYVCDTVASQPTFAEPEPFADSFLPRVVYVKLADFCQCLPRAKRV